jgi:hypothetical protein
LSISSAAARDADAAKLEKLKFHAGNGEKIRGKAE